MQLTKEKHFDVKKIEQVLTTENKFITNLFSKLSLPLRIDENEEEEEEGEEPTENGEIKEEEDAGHSHSKRFKLKDTTRAKSLIELQQRLQAITSKKRLTYKEKLTKKGLKNRMKKKSKRDERNAQQKLLRGHKATETEAKEEPTENGVEAVKTAKPVFNSEGKMVFSKFDFSDIGSKKVKKQEKNPKKILKNLEKQKEKIAELEEAGETEKAVKIKEKAAWKNAMAKAEGQKVKDDPLLLKKSVKKLEQKKRSSKKKWEAREETVRKGMEDRQKKRKENIDKRKKDKKNHNLKKAAKRGKIIPGF